jgi:hypothetical protein
VKKWRTLTGHATAIILLKVELFSKCQTTYIFLLSVQAQQAHVYRGGRGGEGEACSRVREFLEWKGMEQIKIFITTLQTSGMRWVYDVMKTERKRDIF